MHRTFPKAPLPTFMGGAKRLSLRQPMTARLTALPVVRITAPAPGHLVAKLCDRSVPKTALGRRTTHCTPIQFCCHTHCAAAAKMSSHQSVDLQRGYMVSTSTCKDARQLDPLAVVCGPTAACIGSPAAVIKVVSDGLE